MNKLTTGVVACLAMAAALTTHTAVQAQVDEPQLVWDAAGPIGMVTDSEGNPPGTSTGRYFPQVLTAHGNTYAVWVDNRIDDSYGYRNPEIELRISGDDGRTWGPLHNLSSAASPVPNDDYAPSMAANDSSVLVTFPSRPADASTSSFAIDFLTLVKVVGDQVVSRQIGDGWLVTGAAGDAQNYYLVGTLDWGYGPLRVSRSTDDGATFSDPVVVGGANVCVHTDASVDAEGQNVVVAWLDCQNGGAPEVKALASTDAGTTWGPVSALTTTPQRETAPAVHLEAGVATVAWKTPRSTTGRTVDVATSTDGGATWGPATTVDNHSIDNDYGVDHGPWVVPIFSGEGDSLTLYGPLSQNVLSSADRGRTWQVTGSAPDQGRGVVWLNRGVTEWFAWRAQDTESWVGYELSMPGAPAQVAADLTGPRTATVTWAASDTAAEDRVQKYQVRDQTGLLRATVGPDASSAGVSDLTYGTSYRFTVRAVNRVGTADSAASNEVTPVGAPSQVAKPAARVKGRRVILTWQPPAASGSPITHYIVKVEGKRSKTVDGATTRLKFTKMKPGIYRFRVTARNAVGDGPASAWVRARVRR